MDHNREVREVQKSLGQLILPENKITPDKVSKSHTASVNYNKNTMKYKPSSRERREIDSHTVINR